MAVNQNSRNRPAVFIKQALSLLATLDPKYAIVEIGGMRQPCPHPLEDTSHPCCNDGHSSLWWLKTGRTFITCDIDLNSHYQTREAIELEMAKQTTNSTEQHVHIVYGCGLDLLMQYAQHFPDLKIGLLYLDAWDVGVNGYAESHLACWEKARPHLADQHIVLIDDTDIESVNGELFAVPDNQGGKGRLLVPELLNNGYKLHFRDRQTMLSKGILE